MEGIINPENEKPTVSVEAEKKGDYYVDSGKKWTDFIIGFFAPIFVGAIFYSLVLVLNTIGIIARRNIDEAVSLFLAPLLLLLIIVSVIIAFTKKRRFLAIGILSALLLPLLAMGACTGVFLLTVGF